MTKIVAAIFAVLFAVFVVAVLGRHQPDPDLEEIVEQSC